jgi:uncharacterized membrane protein
MCNSIILLFYYSIILLFYYSIISIWSYFTFLLKELDLLKNLKEIHSYSKSLFNFGISDFLVYISYFRLKFSGFNYDDSQPSRSA